MPANPVSAPESTARLQHLLLDLLSPCRPVRQAQVDALSPADWEIVARMVRQHRLGPLLGWQIGRAHAALALPAEFVARLGEATRRSAVRGLQLQQELLGIHRTLSAAGIAYQALKGAFLAFHAYPNASLRPMRDLDIVVPRGDALAAYQALQAAGLRRVADYMAPPEVAMAAHHHLAPLQGRCGQFAVELHTRLFHRVGRGAARSPDPTEEPGFWQRGRQFSMGGEYVHFESPEDLLLHIIVHAVYDHEFNNGPLVLADVAFLLQRHPPDWNVFWARAAEARRVRGCVLVLRLVQRYWAPAEIRWLSPEPWTQGSDPALEEFAALMLCDPDTLPDTVLHSGFAQSKGIVGKTTYFLRRAFVPRATVRADNALPENDWRVYACYLPRWYRQATQQLPKLWRARHGAFPQQAEAERRVALRRWLSVSS